MRIDIRKAEKEDTERLSAVVCETWKDSFSSFLTAGDMEKYADITRREESFRTLFDEGADIFTLLCDNEICAVVTLVRCGEKAFFDCCELRQIYILPKYQRIGFGRKLLCYALRKMREKGYRTARLNVAEKNAKAIAFYEKFGFRTNGAKTRCGDFEAEVFTLSYQIEL